MNAVEPQEHHRMGPQQPEPVDPAESRWDLDEGDEVAPGLHAVKLLGGGYRYEAYLAWSDHLRSLVVVKLIRPGLTGDRHTLEGLASERRMLDALEHPVIVRGFGGDPAGERPHLVLEHLEGPRLSSLLRRYGPLPLEQLVPLAVQVSAAIHYMAAEGFVHLDVKPSNIIMGGPPRLIDLSIARSAEACAEIGSAVGTDAYMAPEQCLPGRGHPIGPAADVWGLGATLHRAVAGQRPFDTEHGAEDPEVRWPQLLEPPKPLPASTPPRVAELIEACLAYRPEDRPSPGELANELELVLETLPKLRISKLKPRLGRR